MDHSRPKNLVQYAGWVAGLVDRLLVHFWSPYIQFTPISISNTSCIIPTTIGSIFLGTWLVGHYRSKNLVQCAGWVVGLMDRLLVHFWSPHFQRIPQ